MKELFTTTNRGDDICSIRYNPPLNMNAKELSIYLGISERKIRSDAAQGIIPSVRIGGRVIFRLKDIEKCLEKCQRGQRK
jgi:excisionase family DNA binding protein